MGDVGLLIVGDVGLLANVGDVGLLIAGDVGLLAGTLQGSSLCQSVYALFRPQSQNWPTGRPGQICSSGKRIYRCSGCIFGPSRGPIDPANQKAHWT